MKLLLKQVTVSDTRSSHNALTKDILIINGLIADIGNDLSANDAQVITAKNAMVSAGWVDIFAHFNDPGFEHKETIATGCKAAAAGGYTHVFTLPNTQPSVAGKTAVEYLLQRQHNNPVQLHPLGAISKNLEGKELAEMYDMHNSGAIAFSDGLLPVQTPGLLLKALQYVKAIDAVIVQMPIDKSIAKFGLVNEGVASTMLGIAGMPSIAEDLIVSRDIELAKYTGGKLHITGVSTAKSLDLVAAAKAEGLAVTCSVTPYHLVLCDEDLGNYDTNMKANPPLRSRTDMMAIRTGVETGLVDSIASHHLPQDWDSKVCEFEYAADGMTGLETAFAVVNDLFPDLPATRISDLFGGNARLLFGLDQQPIEVGVMADLTVFDRSESFIYDRNNIKSLSLNSPFIGKSFSGKVLATVLGNKLNIND